MANHWSDDGTARSALAARVQAGLTLTAVMIGIVFLAAVSPGQLDQLPRTCLWTILAGRPCPGCGTLHALSALLHGDPLGAWDFNPNVAVTAPVIVWIAVLQVRLLVRRPLPPAKAEPAEPPAPSAPSVS
jgi:Protein of unknown function (DUF2752)